MAKALTNVAAKVVAKVVADIVAIYLTKEDSIEGKAAAKS